MGEIGSPRNPRVAGTTPIVTRRGAAGCGGEIYNSATLSLLSILLGRPRGEG